MHIMSFNYQAAFDVDAAAHLTIKTLKQGKIASAESVFKKFGVKSSKFRPLQGYDAAHQFKEKLKEHGAYHQIKQSPAGQSFLKDIKTLLKCDEGAPKAYRNLKKIKKQTEIDKASIETLIKQTKVDCRQSINNARAESNDEILKAKTQATIIVNEAHAVATDIKESATVDVEASKNDIKRLYNDALDKCIINKALANADLVTFYVQEQVITANRTDIDRYDDFISVVASGKQENTLNHGIVKLDENKIKLKDFNTVLGFHQQKKLPDDSSGLIDAINAGKQFSCSELVDACTQKLKFEQDKSMLATKIDSWRNTLYFSRGQLKVATWKRTQDIAEYVSGRRIESGIVHFTYPRSEFKNKLQKISNEMQEYYSSLSEKMTSKIKDSGIKELPSQNAISDLQSLLRDNVENYRLDSFDTEDPIETYRAKLETECRNSFDGFIEGLQATSQAIRLLSFD